MRYLLLPLLLSGCASHQVTLEQLMRESYYVGCGEAALKHVTVKEEAFEIEVKDIIKSCEEKSKTFDLNQTGIYQSNMEIYYKHVQEKK